MKKWKKKKSLKSKIEIRQCIVWPSLARFAHTDLYNQKILTDKESNSDAFKLTPDYNVIQIMTSKTITPEIYPQGWLSST